MEDRNNFGNFDFFSKKKCIIHLVELDELFPKIWVSALKTACGRCGAYAKVEKHVKFTLNLQVTWLNLYQKTDMIWIAYTQTKRDMVKNLRFDTQPTQKSAIKILTSEMFLGDNSW